MLEYANPGNAPRRGCLLWFICMLIFGIIIFQGMKKSIAWSDNKYEQSEISQDR